MCVRQGQKISSSSTDVDVNINFEDHILQRISVVYESQLVRMKVRLRRGGILCQASGHAEGGPHPKTPGVGGPTQQQARSQRPCLNQEGEKSARFWSDRQIQTEIEMKIFKAAKHITNKLFF